MNIWLGACVLRFQASQLGFIEGLNRRVQKNKQIETRLDFWDNPFDTSHMSMEQCIQYWTDSFRSLGNEASPIKSAVPDSYFASYWLKNYINTNTLSFYTVERKAEQFCTFMLLWCPFRKVFLCSQSPQRILRSWLPLISADSVSVTSLCHINLGWTRPFVTLTQRHLPSLLVNLSGQTGCGWTRTSWIILFSSCEGISSRLANSANT